MNLLVYNNCSSGLHISKLCNSPFTYKVWRITQGWHLLCTLTVFKSLWSIKLSANTEKAILTRSVVEVFWNWDYALTRNGNILNWDGVWLGGTFTDDVIKFPPDFDYKLPISLMLSNHTMENCNLLHDIRLLHYQHNLSAECVAYSSKVRCVLSPVDHFVLVLFPRISPHSGPKYIE